MGCGCGSGNVYARNGGRRASGEYRYIFTPPNGGEPVPYLTALEAKKAVRRAGGGQIVRESVPSQS